LTALLDKPQPWKSVRHWLLDLARELDASTRDHSMPEVLSLDRVWITADGGAKLLDFPAPGSKPVPPAEASLFLNHVAISALEGQFASEEEARTRSVRLPIGVRARAVLERLRDVRFDAAAEQLRQVTQQLPAISRLRRFGLVAGCVVPALLLPLFMMGTAKMMESWHLDYPDLIPLRDALAMHSVIENWNLATERDPKARTRAAEIFIAARFGRFIRDPKWWDSRVATVSLLPTMRAEAERIAATYPDPDPAEVEHARTILKPVLNPKGELALLRDRRSDAEFMPPLLLFAGGMMFWVVSFSLAAALLFRGGLLMRVLGIAVVRRDGADASRWRMLWRACIAWALLPLGVVAKVQLDSQGFEKTSLLFVSLPILCVMIWSAANRGRTLQDRLAGTWLVPR
jgi:hypothetical protein